MGRVVFDPSAPPAPKPSSRAKREPIAGLIKEWKILGPFPDKTSDTLDAFAPAFAKNAKWVPIEKGFEPDRIDVQATIGEHDDSSAFVRTTVTSPKDQAVTMILNADDLVRAVLNGELVEGRRVNLRKGENDLVLKVIDHKKGWRFTCAFTQGGKPVKGLSYEAK